MQKLPVAERFVSINGEGAHAGQFSTFVRFRGCNLSCFYCDTRWACANDCPVEELTIRQVVEYVVAQNTPCVTLTGGEPLLQPLLSELVEALIEETSCFVEVETNGACDVSVLTSLRERLGCDRLGLTVDVKSASSGMSAHMRLENLECLGDADCVKFVVGCEQDLDDAAQIISERQLANRCPVFFSPVFGQIDPAEIVQYLTDAGLMFARMQLQLHKLIWPNVEKGV